MEWWLTDGGDYPILQKVVIKPFSMATSTAASERNFSTMGFVHSKLRNSLAPDTVMKLAFIKSNLLAFFDSPEVDSDKCGGDTEIDVDESEAV